MSDFRSTSWGRPAPETHPGPMLACWGARAIYTRHARKPVIDIVPDRQAFDSIAGPDGAHVDQLCRWLNKHGLNCLKAVLTADGSSHDVVTIQSGSFLLQASPQGSYGYLYIGAWMLPS